MYVAVLGDSRLVNLRQEYVRLRQFGWGFLGGFAGWGATAGLGGLATAAVARGHGPLLRVASI
jgi:hypothetical protein